MTGRTSSLGSSVQGILQARILEWVAISFSRGSSWPGDWTPVSGLQANSLPTEPPGKGSTNTWSLKNTYPMAKQIHSWFRYHRNKNHAYAHCCTRILTTGNSLVVQWLGLNAFTVRSAGWISGKGIFRKPNVTAKKMKKREEKRKQVITVKDRMMVALGKRGLWSGKGNGDFKDAASVVC